MAEVDEVAQVMRVTMDGVDICLRVTGAVWTNGKDFIKLLWNVSHREKLQGKTNMKNLLLKGGDLQILQIPGEYKNQFFKVLKNYGVLFAELPDLNREDGLTELLFHAEATNRVNDIIKNLNMGHFIDMEQYFDNADEPELAEEREYFEENFDPEKEPGKLTPEEKEELVKRVKIIDAKENPTMEDITITKRLVISKNEEGYLTRIPYEPGKFFWLKKEDAMWINDGKTLLAKLKRDGEYEILDKNGQLKEKVSGQTLYDKHYDEVSIATKRRAMEQAERQKKQTIQKKRVQKKKKGRS